jgi:predicted O-methyltransferase YrrM
MSYTQDLTGNLEHSVNVLYPQIPNEQMTCVEIGSFEGRGSILLHRYLCSNSNSKLYCIDPFDDEYVKGNQKMAFWDHACKGQLQRFSNNTKSYSKIITLQGTSDDMICKLKDKSIDFVYIDGDHSPEQVYKDAVNMFPKMKKNSVILFDDYLWVMNNIVTAIGIDKFLEEYNGRYELIFKRYQLAIRVI